MDSRLVCHEFKPSIKDSPCREKRCLLNILRLKRPPVGVVWKLGEGSAAQVSSSSLDQGLKLRGQLPLALVQLYGATFFMITNSCCQVVGLSSSALEVEGVM
ncbi:hypothetical protein TNCV_3836501 [Trichonephila clavipes]|nr:hypothetical protein TNCV_3836501 [Trichonephila clavipes]